MGVMNVGTAELRAYARMAKACAPDVYAAFRQGMRAAGELVEADVKARSSWSGRIPGSVRLTVLSATARISAGGPGAPEAAPLNHGGQGGFFRHPVFGHMNVWVSQQARPFLEPALEGNKDAVAGILADAVDDGFLKAVL